MATHSKALASSAVLLLALTAGISVAASAAGAEGGVQGVWRTVEVVVPGPAGSHVQARGDARHLPRPALQPRRSARRTAAAAAGRPGDASADELRAVWGPFVGEAGTFELSGNNTITMQATVAKNPAAMTRRARRASTPTGATATR